MIGRTLSHFRITAKIGEGGMGVVYRAEDTDLRRPVALKVLPPELVANEERRLRFLREARAAAAVTHLNIATVHEVGEAEGQVFIAMELVEGKTLRELIGGRAMPIKDALRVVVQVAEGMARAHEKGVIHRDLKPDNVIVGGDGHAKILDFGLAKLVEEAGRPEGEDLSKPATLSREMTRAGKVLGTVAYMSPEQARGERLDTRSDIFSFGVMLYEMVTGSVPFQGRSTTDVLSAITRDEPVPPSRRNSEVSQELERIIATCLEKDCADRYQVATQLAVDLRKLARAASSGARIAAAPAEAAARARGAAEVGERPRRGPRARLLRAGGGVVAAALLIVALLLAFDVGGIRSLLRPGAGTARIDSLAVLPLRNLSGDPAQEYFSDGMTEELTATLARIGALKVISSTSAMYYKGKQKPLREIAAELGVGAIVEGSVMRSGDRVRVTAQLVEGATDRHLWAASYERDLRDVLALQAEVARAIAGEVKAALRPGEIARIEESRPVDPKAYEHYLAGRHLRARLTAEGLSRAVQEFERAVAQDPMFAPAHAGLAVTYAILPGWSVAPPAEAYPKARAAVQRALELDPGSAEAHAVLAGLKINLDWDWAGAEAEIKRAIELNPNDVFALQAYAGYLTSLGRDEEALSESRRALLLDPVSPNVGYDTAFFLIVGRRNEEALSQLERILALHPDYGPAKDALGQVYAELGRYEEAIAILRERIGKPDAETPIVSALLARAYALAGRQAEARAQISDLVRLSERSYVPPTYVALAYASVGDNNEALRWLGTALEGKDISFGLLRFLSQIDPLRSDPRFAEVLRRVGLPAD